MGGAGRATAARWRQGGVAVGTPRPCAGRVEQQWACPGPAEYRQAWGPMPAGLRQGLGQQPCRGSWGQILAAKKTLHFIVWCALYDLQSCEMCWVPGGVPYSLVRLMVMKLL